MIFSFSLLGTAQSYLNVPPTQTIGSGIYTGANLNSGGTLTIQPNATVIITGSVDMSGGASIILGANATLRVRDGVALSSSTITTAAGSKMVIGYGGGGGGLSMFGTAGSPSNATFNGAVSVRAGNLNLNAYANISFLGVEQDTIIGSVNAISGNATMYVGPDVNLYINGNVETNDNVSVVANGNIKVHGYYNATGNSTIDGDGDITTTGNLWTTGSGSIFGQTNFFCAGSVAIPCHGRPTCGIANTATPSSTVYCGSNITLTGSPITGASYQWQYRTSLSTAYTNVPSGGTSQNYTITSLAGTTYYRRKATLFCSNYSSVITITSGGTRPTASFTVSPTSATCSGTDVTYTTQSGQSNYVWSVPGTSPADYTITSGGIGTGSNTVTLKWVTAGSKTVTVNYTNAGGCNSLTAASSSTTVTVRPTVSFTVFPTSTTCSGTDVTYTTQSGQSNYVWNVPGTSPADYTITSGGIGTGSNTVTLQWVTSGSKTVTVNYTNAGGCNSLTAASSATTVTVRPTATFTVSPASTTCSGTNVTYTTQSGQSNYVWSVPGTSPADYTITSGGIGGSSNTVTLQWLTAGSKTVTVNYTNAGGCNSLAAATSATTVNTTPATPTIAGTTTYCQGMNLSLTASSATSGVTFAWTIPSGSTVAGTSTATISKTSVQSTEAGNYTVIATINSCPSAASSPVTVIINSCVITWTGATSTVWALASNWLPTVIPTAVDTVLIPYPVASTRMPVISATATAAGVKITSGASISLTSSGVFNIYGNVQNNGSINTVSGSNVVFAGNTAQTISGSATNTTLHNIQVNNASGLTLKAPLSVKGTLTLMNGTVTTNDSLLVLLFDDGANIAYNVSDLGSISGNVTGRRMMSNPTGSHYIGSPFGNVQIGQLVKTTPVYVNNRWMVYTKNFATQGWTAVRTLTEPMSLGRGFSVGMLAPAPIVLSGTYTHNQTIASEVVSNSVAEKAILVGNPYPSTIDWDGAGWTKTNVANAVYFWNPSNNTTATYIDGDGVNGGTRYIPAMQAFMVITTGTTGMSGVTMSPMCRVTNTQSFWRTSNTAKVTIEAVSESGMVDQTIVRFRDEALETFELESDALKIMNASLAPSLYTYSSLDGKNLAINSYPTVEQETEIPLHLKVQTNGKYVLRFPSFNLEGYQLILEDKQERVQKVVNGSEEYEINALKTDSVNRFVLKFSSMRNTITTGTKGSSSSHGLSVYSSPGGFMVQTEKYAGLNSMIEILDLTGKTIHMIEHVTLQSGKTQFPLDGVASGAYVVRVYTDNSVFTGNIAVIH